MNEIFTPAPRRPTTQAADGLPRWCWTVAEIEKMAATGIFHENERFELLGGEIVPMSPKGRRHEIVRIELADRFTPGVALQYHRGVRTAVQLESRCLRGAGHSGASARDQDVRLARPRCAAASRGRRDESRLRPDDQGAAL